MISYYQSLNHTDPLHLRKKKKGGGRDKLSASFFNIAYSGGTFPSKIMWIFIFIALKTTVKVNF